MYSRWSSFYSLHTSCTRERQTTNKPPKTAQHPTTSYIKTSNNNKLGRVKYTIDRNTTVFLGNSITRLLLIHFRVSIWLLFYWDKSVDIAPVARVSVQNAGQPDSSSCQNRLEPEECYFSKALLLMLVLLLLWLWRRYVHLEWCEKEEKVASPSLYFLYTPPPLAGVDFTKTNRKRKER